MPVNLDKLTELMAGATQGEWHVTETGASIRATRQIQRENGEFASFSTRICFVYDGPHDQRMIDYLLICAMHEAMPDLLALQAEADRMRGALVEIRCEAAALCARVRELEGSLGFPDELERDYYGHVVPPLARLEIALEGGAAS